MVNKQKFSLKELTNTVEAKDIQIENHTIRAPKRDTFPSHGQSRKTFWRKCRGNWGQMVSSRLPKKHVVGG